MTTKPKVSFELRTATNYHYLLETKEEEVDGVKKRIAASYSAKDMWDVLKKEFGTPDTAEAISLLMSFSNLLLRPCVPRVPELRIEGAEMSEYGPGLSPESGGTPVRTFAKLLATHGYTTTVLYFG
ncbi:hypothetical protein BN946_scf185003.g2 [Trametes cinnabarina]|uniref:Uncharacterized protein n=1 Tax=Pycnoporus cinnabarinus TaxID=5643 RepID=A0A060S1G2_PYCCI|nr:hypothetical protein BN946_scf185003.g2 [Trametes cinnabarina]